MLFIFAKTISSEVRDFGERRAEKSEFPILLTDNHAKETIVIYTENFCEWLLIEISSKATDFGELFKTIEEYYLKLLKQVFIKII